MLYADDGVTPDERAPPEKTREVEGALSPALLTLVEMIAQVESPEPTEIAAPDTRVREVSDETELTVPTHSGVPVSFV